MSTLKLEESGEGGPPGEGCLEKDKGLVQEEPRGDTSGDIVKVITIADMLEIILVLLKRNGMKVQNA